MKPKRRTKTETSNWRLAKKRGQWINDPDSYRDCASYQVQCWQPVLYFDREDSRPLSLQAQKRCAVRL